MGLNFKIGSRIEQLNIFLASLIFSRTIPDKQILPFSQTLTCSHAAHNQRTQNTSECSITTTHTDDCDCVFILQKNHSTSLFSSKLQGIKQITLQTSVLNMFPQMFHNKSPIKNNGFLCFKHYRAFKLKKKKTEKMLICINMSVDLTGQIGQIKTRLSVK